MGSETQLSSGKTVLYIHFKKHILFIFILLVLEKFSASLTSLGKYCRSVDNIHVFWNFIEFGIYDLCLVMYGWQICPESNILILNCFKYIYLLRFVVHKSSQGHFFMLLKLVWLILTLQFHFSTAGVYK